MNDKDKPADPVPPPAEKPATPEKPDRVQLMREKVAQKPQKPVQVPSLDKEQSYGFGKKINQLDDEIERELQEAMAGLSDKDLYGEDKGRKPRGSAPAEAKKKGRVISVHGQDVFIEVPGGRTQGVMPILQFPDGPPAIGSEVEVHIDGFDNANGLLLLSRHGAAVEADWSSVAIGMVVEARVTGTNKGGLEVNINGIRGFMPISQIDLYRVENAEEYLNQKLLCMVAEVDPAERNLVVSRKALLEKEREAQREKLWLTLEEGQVHQGVVRSIKEFGAFVDLGGVDGLLHISEMSWTRVEKPEEMVKPGQSVKVLVLKIDREKRKVSLGLKQLAASPWDSVTETYPAGRVVGGKVTRTADFGAFVELEPAIEGLIHISELAPQRVRRVTDIVKVGQDVQVMILSVDPSARRISLSLKAALPKEPEPEAAEEDEDETVEPAKPKPRNFELRGGTK